MSCHKLYTPPANMMDLDDFREEMSQNSYGHGWALVTVSQTPAVVRDDSRLIYLITYAYRCWSGEGFLFVHQAATATWPFDRIYPCSDTSGKTLPAPYWPSRAIYPWP